MSARKSGHTWNQHGRPTSFCCRSNMTNDTHGLKTTVIQIGYSECPVSRVVGQNRRTAEGGTGGSHPPLVKSDPDVSRSMAVRAPSPDESTDPIDITREIYLEPLGIDIPSGATCNVTFRGTRASFVVRIERDATTWTLEGAGSTAELTGVFCDDGAAEKPERVPDWIARVMDAKIDVSEVSVQR